MGFGSNLAYPLHSDNGQYMSQHFNITLRHHSRSIPKPCDFAANEVFRFLMCVVGREKNNGQLGKMAKPGTVIVVNTE